MKRYLFIANPNAGRGRGRAIIPEIKAYLQQHSIIGEIWETKARWDAVDLVQKGLQAGFEVIVAVGGDGTIHEVANGLLRVGKSVPMGAIRVGTGNDLLRHLQVPTDLNEAMRIILQGKEIKMDAGKVADRYFVNALGVGFDAEVALETQRIHRLKGTAVYLYAVMKRLMKFHTPKVRIQMDEQVFDGEITLVTLGNGVSSGGGFKLTPNARVDDGWFDICLIKAVPRWKVFTILPRVLWGGHINLPDVQMSRAKHVIIDSADDLQAHLEGEIIDLDRHHLEITLIPGCLRMIVP